MCSTNKSTLLHFMLERMLHHMCVHTLFHASRKIVIHERHCKAEQSMPLDDFMYRFRTKSSRSREFASSKINRCQFHQLVTIL
jgi:hypothetical protein